MSEKKIGLIDQFNQLKEKRQKAKENKARGPIDVAAVRAQVKDWNKENRKP